MVVIVPVYLGLVTAYLSWRPPGQLVFRRLAFSIARTKIPGLTVQWKGIDIADPTVLNVRVQNFGGDIAPSSFEGGEATLEGSSATYVATLGATPREGAWEVSEQAGRFKVELKPQLIKSRESPSITLLLDGRPADLESKVRLANVSGEDAARRARGLRRGAKTALMILFGGLVLAGLNVVDEERSIWPVLELFTLTALAGGVLTGIAAAIEGSHLEEGERD